MMLAGKSAIVIGASRGIGAASARALAAQGARVVVASRDIAGLEALADDIRAAGGTALPFQVDVRDPAAIEASVAFAVTSFGGLDIAFNNAAVNPVRSPFAEHPLADFDDVVAANLRAVFVAMRAEIRAMLDNGGGSIINTSSSAGLVGLPGMAAYVASKHGVVGLTKAAALEYGRQKIRVNTIAPGGVMTDMLKSGSGATPEGQDLIRQVTPMGRIGEPDEVAGCVLWLASGLSSYVTGAVVPVDGGYVIP